MIALIEKHNDYINTKLQLEFSKKSLIQQEVHYEELYRYQNRIKEFRHNTKNSLIVLLALIQNNQIEEAKEEINKGLTLMDESKNIVNSGHPVLDALLQSKYETALSKNIDTIFSIKIDTPIIIDSFDLGIMIGNAVDNAIEAVEKIDTVSADNKRIRVGIISVNETLSVEIANPVAENINISELSSTKPDKNLHGLGIKSMRAIAEKYNGDLFFTCKNNIFTVNIIISNVSH